MRAKKAKVTRAIPVGARIVCADNTGAKILKVIGVKGYRPTRRRIPAAGVGDVVICSVVSGKPDLKHKVVQAVIIRQRKEYRRPDGTRIKFSDNAAILFNLDKEEPLGSEIKGPVAREVLERFPEVGSCASKVV